jgi:hypothetical protein
MASIDHQMTAIYVFVDDSLKAPPTLAQWRPSNHSQPALTDAQVITIGLRQGCLGVARLNQAYLLIARNHQRAVAGLCSYKQWLARLPRLSEVIGQLVLAVRTTSRWSLSVMDAQPIPLCLPIGHSRVGLWREEGASFGKTSTGWFFGFKLQALMTIDGPLVDSFLTPANWDDGDVALALGLATDGGLVLADLGSRGPTTAQLLAQEADWLLITPADAADRRAVVSPLRGRIETLFSQRRNRFIDRLFSGSWHGLWNRSNSKCSTTRSCMLVCSPQLKTGV